MTFKHILIGIMLLVFAMLSSCAVYTGDEPEYHYGHPYYHGYYHDHDHYYDYDHHRGHHHHYDYDDFDEHHVN